MKKKIKLILGLGLLSVLCLGVGACTSSTLLDDYQKQGYYITVSYDANGGKYMDRNGVTVVDMFKPSDYQQDSNGEIHIKLLEPTDKSRPNGGGSDSITLTKQNHFFAGWYQTRTLVTNESGVVVDEEGKELLELEDGSYIYADTVNNEYPISATPAYLYSDYWDFETDTFDYSEEDGIVSMTLYAGWVPYYEFHYYYQSNGEWVMYNSTSFDYKTTNAEGSQTSDKDTIFLPQWSDGAMSYTHKYNNGSTYNFPKIEDTTFLKAYFDESCTPESEIVGSFEHTGTLDLEHAKAINRIQNVYVVLDEGEQYRIETAQQLSDNPNLKGYYEIFADLDFSEVTWPAAFTNGEFKGKLYGAGGNTYTIKNVSASFNSTTVKSGGLFGSIADKALIQNINFENITLDIATVDGRATDTTFGLFAGEIADDAVISNVSVSGTLKLGSISLATGYSVNLLANGNVSGITKNTINLQVYGKKLVDTYNYLINPDTVKVDENGNITLEFQSRLEKTEAIYNIEIK